MFGRATITLGIGPHSSVIYVVPVSHLKTGMQGRINIIISLNRKIFNYYDYSTND